MTEKRYRLSEPNGAYLIDNDKPYAHWINDDDKIIDLLNEQHETIQRLEAQLSHIEYRFTEYRNKVGKND